MRCWRKVNAPPSALAGCTPTTLTRMGQHIFNRMTAGAVLCEGHSSSAAVRFAMALWQYQSCDLTDHLRLDTSRARQ